MHNKSELLAAKPISENLHTTTTGQPCTTQVVLMTLRVNISGINKTRNVSFLLHCGSQKTCILKSLAVELGLPIISKETIVHTLFAGMRSDPKVHNKYGVKFFRPRCNLWRYTKCF